MAEKDTVLKLFRQGLSKEALFKLKYEGVEPKDTKAFVERVLYEDHMEQLRNDSKVS